MYTLVKRNRKSSDHSMFNLSEDARKRAKEYLKSAGYDLERIQPLIWPEDAISAHRDSIYEPWQFTTKSDVYKAKQKRMESHLWWKREYEVICRKPLYLWVFWCPGINDFFYKGWWIYLIGNGGISESVKLDKNDKIGSQIMRLFPLVETTLFQDNYSYVKKWKSKFVKQYHRGKWCGKPQGKAPVWAEVEGRKIVNILCKTQWPDK